MIQYIIWKQQLEERLERFIFTEDDVKESIHYNDLGMLRRLLFFHRFYRKMDLTKALVYACFHNHEVVEVLLNNGAYPNQECLFNAAVTDEVLLQKLLFWRKLRSTILFNRGVIELRLVDEEELQLC